jgi:hypothetical protein
MSKKNLIFSLVRFQKSLFFLPSKFSISNIIPKDLKNEICPISTFQFRNLKINFLDPRFLSELVIFSKPRIK